MRLDLARDYWTNARNRELTWAGCKLKPRAPMQEVRQRQLRFLRAVPTAALTGLTRAEHRSTPMDTLGTHNAHHGDAPHCGQTTNATQVNYHNRARLSGAHAGGDTIHITDTYANGQEARPEAV